MVGMKTREMCREVAIWWRVGIRRGCLSGGAEGLSSSGGRAEEGGGGGFWAWGMEFWREVKKAVRGWQIMSVVG